MYSTFTFYPVYFTFTSLKYNCVFVNFTRLASCYYTEIVRKGSSWVVYYTFHFSFRNSVSLRKVRAWFGVAYWNIFYTMKISCWPRICMILNNSRTCLIGHIYIMVNQLNFVPISFYSCYLNLYQGHIYWVSWVVFIVRFEILTQVIL